MISILHDCPQVLILFKDLFLQIKLNLIPHFVINLRAVKVMYTFTWLLNFIFLLNFFLTTCFATESAKYICDLEWNMMRWKLKVTKWKLIIIKLKNICVMQVWKFRDIHWRVIVLFRISLSMISSVIRILIKIKP